MNSSFSWMAPLVIPDPFRVPKKAVHEGSTPVDVNPFSES